MTSHKLGILFVHGIGEQHEGGTLLAFGEPLMQWVKRWLARSTETGLTGELEVSGTTLTPSKSGQSVPAHAQATIRLTDNGVTTESTWLVAESWWGGDVQAPPFARFAGWMLTSGAWTVLSHAMKPAFSHKKRAARIAASAWGFTWGLIAAVLLQVLVVLLAILALLPIPPLRRVLSSVLVTLTGVLGDSYILVESDLQRSAVVERTRDAINWVATQCETVVVIAHSQGAAIAHHALRRGGPLNVQLLLTYGSGLGKLEELMHSSRSSAHVRTVARSGALIVILLVLLTRMIFYERVTGMGFGIYIVGFLVFAAVAFALAAVKTHWETIDKGVATLGFANRPPTFRWVDVFSSHDPVSNGSLSPHGTAIANLEEHRIVNLRSILSDHTAYWGNRCEFIPLVARRIDAVAKLGLFSESDEKTLAEVAAHHQRDVRWLTATKWASWVAVIALFVRYWDPLLADGRTVSAAVQLIDTPLEKFAEGVSSTALWVATLLFGPRALEIGLRIVGAAVPIALIALWTYAYGFVWRWWDDLAMERVLKPKMHADPVDRASISLLVLAAGFVPLFVVLGWPALRRIQVGMTISVVWAVFLGLILVVGFTRIAIKAGPLITRARKGDFAARAELKQDVLGLGGMTFLFVFIMTFVVPGLERVRDTAMLLVAGGLFVAFLARGHLELVRRLAAITSTRFGRYGIFAAPVALGVWFGYRAVGFAAPEDKIIDPLMVGAGGYLFGLLVVWGIVALVDRRHRRTHPERTRVSG